MNTKHRHEEAALRRSLDTMAAHGLRSVILIGGGEPTLYLGFADFVHHLKTLGLQVAVVSNGSRGDRLRECATWLDERDWIRLSLDASSNELFRAMHKPATKNLTLDEICAWVPRIKQVSPRVRVGFSFIIVWRGTEGAGAVVHENIDEIVPAAARARRYGFDYIAFKPVLERAPDGAEVMDPTGALGRFEAVVRRVQSEVGRAKKLATDSFLVYESINLKALIDGSWKEYTRQPRTCHMQALRQVLTPLGLFNCPAHRGVEKARIAGKDAFADEAALTDTTERLASLLDRFDASRECAHVTCIYNLANWWVERMIEDPREAAEVEPGAECDDTFL